ncbi:hypothetical protein OF83DRAFT_1172794 [Amylostereum chailletii]|nr:hypothetical protein OF83DRAFT_1172794 [Amylostereum chailletii]
MAQTPDVNPTSAPVSDAEHLLAISNGRLAIAMTAMCGACPEERVSLAEGVMMELLSSLMCVGLLRCLDRKDDAPILVTNSFRTVADAAIRGEHPSVSLSQLSPIPPQVAWIQNIPGAVQDHLLRLEPWWLWTAAQHTSMEAKSAWRLLPAIAWPIRTQWEQPMEVDKQSTSPGDRGIWWPSVVDLCEAWVKRSATYSGPLRLLGTEDESIQDALANAAGFLLNPTPAVSSKRTLTAEDAGLYLRQLRKLASKSSRLHLRLIAYRRSKQQQRWTMQHELLRTGGRDEIAAAPPLLDFMKELWEAEVFDLEDEEIRGYTEVLNMEKQARDHGVYEITERLIQSLRIEDEEAELRRRAQESNEGTSEDGNEQGAAGGPGPAHRHRV